MRIFLASSRESIGDMHIVAHMLEQLGHEPLPWDTPGVFLPGTYTLNGIIEISRNVDAAIFIFAEDDRVWYRATERQQPRDNVLVEYGLFAGILGPERALICRKGEPKTPSDLTGLVHIDISKGKIEAARAEIESWLLRLSKDRSTYSHSLLERDYVRIVTSNRRLLDKEYRERKLTARTIDIVSMALSSALDEIATDPNCALLKRILYDNAQVRLMFVTPTSPCVLQRAAEDGDSVAGLQAKLKDAVRRVVQIYELLKRLFDEEKQRGNIRPDRMGSLEIRVLDFCPHFTIYRTDNSVLWGIYTATNLGLYSAVLQVKKSHEDLFQQMIQHFDSLWKFPSLERAAEESYLISCHCHVQPMLNEKLVNELLGEPAKH